MFKKAKTKKNLIMLLSAILGVVFAFITGVTYCAKSITLQYGVSPKSTMAYLANQQYHLTNDTDDNPILFGEGSHNAEIALHYAFDYDFDVRLKYRLTWSGGASATNVILHFVERDNIIYDENYIFLANSIDAGNGKRTIISGVDFVDPTDSTYFGQTLHIEILDVKVYKQQNSYVKGVHLFTTGLSTSPAAEMWINYKNRQTSSQSYVMMYNYRRNYETGLPYSGLETAYKKSANASNTVDSGNYSWLGGNRAYAGTGMYVITGSTPVKLQVKVAGIWRDNNNADINQNNKDQEGKTIISENSIKFNYAEDWVHSSWDFTRLWETRTFDYYIPANSGYYINILDSVEIISADRIATNLYDAYRLVTNSITINPGLTGLENVFTYDETNADYIQIQTLNSNSALSVTNSYADKPRTGIDVINSSIYRNGLYESHVTAYDELQEFKTNINFVNTTSQTKTVNVSYELYYIISNGSTDLTYETKEGETVTAYTRADEYLNPPTVTDFDVFNHSQNLYYSYSIKTEQLGSGLKSKVTIAPYSSVAICESYQVNYQLRDEITNLFDPLKNGAQEDGLTDRYDVWTYLVATPKVVTTETTADLSIEKSVDENGKVELSVKNNTNSTVSGIQINSLTVQELEEDSYEQENIGTAPADWQVNYWKYYTRSGTEGNYTYTQLTTAPAYAAGNFYKKVQEYNNLTYSSVDISGKSLKPGETVVFATATTTAGKQIKVTGFASCSTVTNEQTAMLINAGDDSAYIINTSETQSYYIRFTGTYSGTDTKRIVSVNVVENGNTVTYNYYIGILRPGQILNVPMSAIGEMKAADKIVATGDYNASALTTAGWASEAITKLTNLFTVK